MFGRGWGPGGEPEGEEGLGEVEGLEEEENLREEGLGEQGGLGRRAWRRKAWVSAPGGGGPVALRGALGKRARGGPKEVQALGSRKAWKAQHGPAGSRGEGLCPSVHGGEAPATLCRGPI